MTEIKDYGLRYTVRYLYDLQKLRIASNNRPAPKGENIEVHISDEDAAFLANLGNGLEYLEKEALGRIKKQLKRYPISKWLLAQKGCGPTLTGVLISEVDIHRCQTVSALWHFAGMSVDSETGQAVKRRKGARITYNPFLKDKMLKVLADCLIKSNSPWRKFYDDYKHRKNSQMVAECMGCANLKTKKEKAICKNCGGTGGPAKWGMSDLHRSNASRRYMVKMFLQAFWLEWRELEGLDVREPYAVEYLGKVHHG